MSQVAEEVTRTIESANSDSLPAQVSEENAPTQEVANQNSGEPQTEEDFLALASNKVELDLEDAPFLADESEVSEEENSSKNDSNVSSNEDEDLENEGSFFSRKKKLILIGAGVALLLLIGLGVLIVPSLLEDDGVLQNVIVVPSADVKRGPMVQQVKLEPFFVQCTDASGNIHFLQATFVLSSSNTDVFHEISNNQKVIRDTIYYFLNIQSPSMLLDTTNQKQIKEELFNAVNDVIVSGSLDDLFIDSYLIK